MLDKIVALLEDEAIERKIAAVIVLGELKVKSPEATHGLVACLESSIPLLQVHALDALGRAKPQRAMPAIFAAMGSTNGEVRKAAERALVNYGDDALQAIKLRLKEASPEERRSLDSVLADLGGKSAFSTLLGSLTSQDEDAAKRAAVAVRQHVKQSDAKDKRAYLTETEKFLAKARESKNVPAIIGAIKILGYIEDERAVPTLLKCATDKKMHDSAKQEAFIAVRFCMSGKKADRKLVDALVASAESTDRTLAQAALLTLASIDVAPEATKPLFRLVSHPDFARAAMVMEQLGRRKDKEAAHVLCEALVKLDKPRAELAAKVLAGNEIAVPELARALMETESADKGWLLRNVLRPMAKKILPALRKEIRATVIERLAQSGRGWEALLDVARESDPDALTSDLRALFAKLDKGTKEERALSVLRLITRSEKATDEDRAALATRELRKAKLDTSTRARASDEALRAVSDLARKGFDIGKVLKKDKKLPLESLYYAGFHFVELGNALGEELLLEVANRAGRAKLGKMAKNKLKLVQAN